MAMATGAAISRRANVFNSDGIEPGLAGWPPAGGMMIQIGTTRFDALFSDVYGMENNCMSGIAMFIV